MNERILKYLKSNEITENKWAVIAILMRIKSLLQFMKKYIFLNLIITF